MKTKEQNTKLVEVFKTIEESTKEGLGVLNSQSPQSNKSLSKGLNKDKVKAYSKNPKLCAHCHKPLSYKNRHLKYCNSKCRQKLTPVVDRVLKGQEEKTVIRRYNKKSPKIQKYPKYGLIRTLYYNIANFFKWIYKIIW